MMDGGDIRVTVLDERGRQVGPDAWVSCSRTLRCGQLVTLTLGGRARRFRVRDVGDGGGSVYVVEVKERAPAA